MKPSDRVANQKPYYFDSLNRKISQFIADGVDIIRLDIGSPDLPPAPFIIEKLVSETRNPGQHGYSPYGGTVEFREAVATYYLDRYGVSLNPQEEVLGLIGSKEGVFHINQAVLNPGDLALIPQPGYPTYKVGVQFSGGEVHSFPLLEKNDFLPDLSQIPPELVDRAKIIWLNYPNNPTGAVATLDAFTRIVQFALDHQILIFHDAPYMEIYYGDQKPPSILEVPGAKEIAVEFNSLSKSYNMAGWRVGMAVGNRDLIRSLHSVKMQIDTSNFLPIQAASVVALTGDQTWLSDRNAVYKERYLVVLRGLKKIGLEATPPEAAIYVWFHLPEGSDDRIFCADLLEETGVSVTPGSIYGEAGRGFARIALCTPIDRIEEAMSRVFDWSKVKI